MEPASSNRYVNREICILRFQARVLEEAKDPSVPLLERLKFLSIVASNLDEFFMVRVGGLMLIRDAGLDPQDPTGMTCSQQLKAIRTQARVLIDAQYNCWNKSIKPALEGHGIRILTPNQMSNEQINFAENYFFSDLVPLLTPIALDPERQEPLHLTALSLYVAAAISPRKPSRRPRHTLVALPAVAGRFIPLPTSEGHAFATMESLITHFLPRLFPGETILEHVVFRVTRNADMRVEEDRAPDLLAGMKDILQARRRSGYVRFEVESSVSKQLASFLRRFTGTAPENIYRVIGPLNLAAFNSLAAIEEYDSLRYPSFSPAWPPELDPRAPVFDALARKPMLLVHPYESFDPIVKFIEEAAVDPQVLAIKQILYRTSRKSPVVAALANAASHGKHVTVIVELKARFDEARNIDWAGRLEEAGVQVIYGIKGLKTHAKLCLVIRREPQGIMRYAHFGTGNYNENTARLYTDVSYMTTHPALCTEAAEFFNAICGQSQPPAYAHLAAAPLGLKEKIISLIEAETERKHQGDRHARIMAKLNALTDTDVIDSLYKASKAGVQILLNVRGPCCLRAGVKGLSENITVISVVDRFLEHARILRFHHGGEDKLFISSADWMLRNLERRIELLVPVEDPVCKRKLAGILESGLSDNVKARRLLPNDTYERVLPGRHKPYRSQEELLRFAREEHTIAARARRTVFIPHLPQKP